MNFSRVFVLLLPFYLVLTCAGQNPAIEHNSLLWKIEGNNIQTSYLYGTLHMLPQEQFNLKEKVKAAFTKSQQLVLELDMDQPGLQMTILKHMPMKEGNTLDKLMSQDDYQKLDARLRTLLGTGVQMFNTWKPFGITSMLYIQYTGGMPASFEGTFVKMAKEQQKEVLGLESVEEQMAVFDAIPYPEQIKDVLEMLHDEAGNQALFDQVVTLYLQENIKGLHQLINQYLDTPEELEYLLYRRNGQWIPEISKMAALKPTFFGVGAAHLWGDQGLIDLLRKAGYQVTPVYQ